MTYVSPLLDRPRAAAFQGDSLLDKEGVAWHYGDPLVEQRYVENGTVVIDRSQRRVLAVTGPEAAVYLNNLLSQKLDDAPSGYAASALDFDIQGHILHAADVAVVSPTEIYLDVPDAQFESLRDYLTKMIFWSQVEVAEADLAILTLLGKPVDGFDAAAGGIVFDRTVDWLGAPRRDLAVLRAELVTTVEALEAAGAHLAGLMAFTAERVRAREPELAADLDDKAIAHEVPQWIGRGEHSGAVHLNKGCYRGQETVARVENLGRSPRLLVLLYLDGSAPNRPEPGADILSGPGGRRVGRLGTVVDDCDFGPIALGLVKRSALTGADLVTGPLGGEANVAASVEPESIPTDEGPKAGRAAVEKLRGR
ncbi:folate-binding protein [Corynebacterium phoceense]|uniref:CAF17-like 4Fe-4S cluster assembly/insertion protein YgfZ n=1 Tax=Corynebacterium phoceense TaxID=1686286 RepID=UPI001D2511E6|nr:folate-binding protein [Corynebacterium phoceense]MCQ9333724.1 folate-binding protein [Corynebacterium phoceense]HJG43693.1 folate-binding protein [Corynebacterium phoceense]